MTNDKSRYIFDKFDEVERRVERLDDKVNDLSNNVEDLRLCMAVNTTVTTEVRDILTSYKTLTKLSACVAKWGTVMGTFLLMLWHVWQKITGKL